MGSCGTWFSLLSRVCWNDFAKAHTQSDAMQRLWYHWPLSHGRIYTPFSKIHTTTHMHTLSLSLSHRTQTEHLLNSAVVWLSPPKAKKERDRNQTQTCTHGAELPNKLTRPQPACSHTQRRVSHARLHVFTRADKRTRKTDVRVHARAHGNAVNDHGWLIGVMCGRFLHIFRLVVVPATVARIK